MKHNNSKFYLIWIPVCLAIALIAAILVTNAGSNSLYDCAGGTCVGGGTTYTRGFIDVGHFCTTCGPVAGDWQQTLLIYTVGITAMYFVLFSALLLGILFLIRHFTKAKK